MSMLKQLEELEEIIAKKSSSKELKSITALADQAIASMRDSVNNNQAVMGEIISRISIKPKEFLVVRDNMGDMVKIIPVYDDGR